MHSQLFRCLLCFVLCYYAFSLEVKTEIGTLIGKFQQFDTKGVLNFLGIPYAEPPVGELRFQPPRRKKFLTEPLIAEQTSAICPQGEFEKTLLNFNKESDGFSRMSEDCLYMNIQIPSVDGQFPREKLPVVFFVHPGAWLFGSGDHIDGRWLAINGNVIVVTFNYRLGILGFLQTEDRTIINNGLKDQIMALEFVYDNIERFGGDRDAITVLGHSAGGASAVYLQAVRELRGKIRRVIALEGVPGSSWATFEATERHNLTDHIVKASGCHDDYLNCLRSKNIEELVQITADVTGKTKSAAWKPSYDHILIDPEFTTYASEFSRSGFKQVDLMTSMSVCEGITLCALVLQNPELVKNLLKKKMMKTDEIKKLSLIGYLPHADKLLRDAVGGDEMPVMKAVDLITELSNLYPMYNLARSHDLVTGDERRTYLFTHDYVPRDKQGLLFRPDSERRAVHGDILPLLFGNFLAEDAHILDKEMGQKFQNYIINFIKTGDPNKPRPVPVKWGEFKIFQSRNLFFNDDGFEVRREFKLPVKSVQYWNEHYYKTSEVLDGHDEL